MNSLDPRRRLNLAHILRRDTAKPTTRTRPGRRQLVFVGSVICLLVAIVLASTQLGRTPSKQGTVVHQGGEYSSIGAPAAPTAPALMPTPVGDVIPSYADPAANKPGDVSTAPNNTTNQANAPAWDRMIIRTATLDLQVKDVSASMDKVRSIASGHGGFISQSTSQAQGDSATATITLQVPTQDFDAVVSALRGIAARVVTEKVGSDDVTDQYTDLQSQLRNMQATETRLLALMQKAESVDDILTVDRELRDIRGQIEQTQGRINYLGTRSDMATLTVNLSPVPVVAEPAPVPTVAPQEVWNPGEVAAQAWSASLAMLEGVATAVISVGVFFWWTVPLAMFGLWLLLRFRRDQSDTSSTVGQSVDA